MYVTVPHPENLSQLFAADHKSQILCKNVCNAHIFVCVTDSPSLNNSVSDVHRKRTVGSLDMGGGSAQITFEVTKSVSTYMQMYEETEMFTKM